MRKALLFACGYLPPPQYRALRVPAQRARTSRGNRTNQERVRPHLAQRGKHSAGWLRTGSVQRREEERPHLAVLTNLSPWICNEPVLMNPATLTGRSVTVQIKTFYVACDVAARPATPCAAGQNALLEGCTLATSWPVGQSASRPVGQFFSGSHPLASY